MRSHQDTFGESSVTQTRAVFCATKASPMSAYAILIRLFLVLMTPRSLPALWNLDLIVCLSCRTNDISSQTHYSETEHIPPGRLEHCGRWTFFYYLFFTLCLFNPLPKADCCFPVSSGDRESNKSNQSSESCLTCFIFCFWAYSRALYCFALCAPCVKAILDKLSKPMTPASDIRERKEPISWGRIGSAYVIRTWEKKFH